MSLSVLQEIHAKQQLSKSRAAGLGDDEYEGFLELHAMLPKKKGRFSDEQASSLGCRVVHLMHSWGIARISLIPQQ